MATAASRAAWLEEQYNNRARVPGHPQILARWAAEEAAREAEFGRLQRGELTESDLLVIRARHHAENARRAGEVAVWEIENEAAAARIRREDVEVAEFAARMAQEVLHVVR